MLTRKLTKNLPLSHEIIVNTTHYERFCNSLKSFLALFIIIFGFSGICKEMDASMFVCKAHSAICC